MSPMAKLDTQTVPGELPVLTKNALKVLQNRYLIKDEQGKCIETPAQLFSRVASLVAEAEAQYGATPAKSSSGTKNITT